MKIFQKTIIFLALALNFWPVLCWAQMAYTPMEAIPGFGRPGDLYGYLSAVYKFGLWTIGISAMLMIMIGGYMYLTSAGNTSTTGKAKEIITDAIAGLILAMVSWLILYTINPDLLNINF